MIYLNIVLQVRNSKDLLAKCIKQKAKEQFRTAVILSGTFAKFQKATTDFVVCVCLSARNNSAPTGRVFIKFGFEGFFENLSRKFNFH
jgi:hypothetical protein